MRFLFLSVWYFVFIQVLIRHHHQYVNSFSFLPYSSYQGHNKFDSKLLSNTDQHACVIPLIDVTSKMKDYMLGSIDQSIATVGYVTRKRAFGEALAFIDIVQDSETYQQPLQALFKKQDYHQYRSKSRFSSILKSIHPGTKIYIEGVPSTTNNPGEVVLLITHVRFLCVSRNPEHTKGLLQRINLTAGASSYDQGDGLDMEEMSSAMHVNTDRLSMVLLGHANPEYILEDETNQIDFGNTYITNGQRIPYSRIAKLITQILPNDLDYPHRALEYKRKHQEVQALSSTDRRSQKNTKRVFSNLLPAPEQVAFVPQCITGFLNSTYEHVQSSVERILDESFLGYSIINDDPKLVTLTGWVQNRRRFQCAESCLSILELVEELSSVDNTEEKPDRLKCILHPDIFMQKDFTADHHTEQSVVYGQLLSKGCKVLLNGILLFDKERPILWVTGAKIMQLSWAPNVLKYFLDLISTKGELENKLFDFDEIACALNLRQNEVKDLIAYCQTQGSTERQWKSAELSRHLQDEKTRMGTFTKEMEDAMNLYSHLRTKYPLQHVSLLDTNNHTDLAPMPNRRKGHDGMRKSTDGSRWNRKKRPQLNWMVAQIKQVCESHPDFRNRPLNILDVGGGRGHLANYLATILGQDVARVHVIDIDSSTVRNGEMDASQRNLNHVYFGVGDASMKSSVDRLLPQDSKYDIIVALHACGSLSDVALGHAIVNQASFVITPCCFRSNPELKVLKRSQHETDLTLVTPSEFLDISEQHRLALTAAAELQGDISVSGKAIHTICAVRAQAVERNLEDSLLRDVSIKTFPVGLSTRNYCIVGKIMK